MSPSEIGVSSSSTPLQFGALAEVLPQIIWSVNPDGELEYYHHQRSEYTGMTLKETRRLGGGTCPASRGPAAVPDPLEARGGDG